MPGYSIAPLHGIVIDCKEAEMIFPIPTTIHPLTLSPIASTKTLTGVWFKSRELRQNIKHTALLPGALGFLCCPTFHNFPPIRMANVRENMAKT